MVPDASVEEAAAGTQRGKMDLNAVETYLRSTETHINICKNVFQSKKPKKGFNLEQIGGVLMYGAAEMRAFAGKNGPEPEGRQQMVKSPSLCRARVTVPDASTAAPAEASAQSAREEYDISSPGKILEDAGKVKTELAPIYKVGID